MFENVIEKKEVMEVVYKHSIHKAITTKAIKRLSAMGEKGGNTGALAIVNSGYTDPIYEDLCSVALLQLMEVINQGLCTVQLTFDEKGNEVAKLVFSDEDEDGKSDAFLSVYRSVSKCLYANKQREYKWLHIEEMDEDGNTSLYSINDKMALSARSDMEVLEDMEVIKTVRKALKDSDGEVLTDLLNGLSYREIASRRNATKKAVECAVNRIRKAYPKEEIKRLSTIPTSTFDDTIHTRFTVETPTPKRTTPVTYDMITRYVDVKKRKGVTIPTPKKQTNVVYAPIEKKEVTAKVKESFNLYTAIQSDLVKVARDTTLPHVVVDTTPKAMLGGPSGWKEKSKITKVTYQPKKHIASCTPFDISRDRVMLLHDRLNTPKVIVEKPIVKVIKKERVK